MKKNAILCSAPLGAVQKKAIETLSRTIMNYTRCAPLCLPWGSEVPGDYRCFYIGTRENHPYIALHADPQLTQPESYSLRIENDTVIIEGFNDAGVLYGCIDFYHKYLLRMEYAGERDDYLSHYWHNPFEGSLPDFSYRSAPCIRHRGIWSWGHVIYDYRGFIDHMVALKMNTLILWNDFVPFNAAEMIEYAHANAIKVIWGFAWGWDTHCKNLSLSGLEGQTQKILNTFSKEYASLPIDGIYFQSITEVKTEHLGGIPVADAVTDFVNRTAAQFFEMMPELELQFGLHATSVKNRLDVIRRVDPRIRIVWEDCGSMPFSYFPHQLEGFEETKAFSQKIATLRGQEDRFGVVLKGFTKLSWSTFEHLGGPIFAGSAPNSVQADKITERQKVWKYSQAYWLKNGDKALEIIKAMADAKAGDLYVTALVEDGMFEKNLMFPVALYGEMLWDCDADFRALMAEVALRDDITFA